MKLVSIYQLILFVSIYTMKKSKRPYIFRKMTKLLIIALLFLTSLTTSVQKDGAGLGLPYTPNTSPLKRILLRVEKELFYIGN